MRFGTKQYIGAGIDQTTGKRALYGSMGGYFAAAVDAAANTTYRLVVKVSNDGLNDPLSLSSIRVLPLKAPLISA